MAGCGSDPGPGAGAPPSSPPAAASEDPVGAPDQAAATQAATDFLVSLVAADHAAAYPLLSPAAQTTITQDDCAGARLATSNSARGLGQGDTVTGSVPGPAG